MTVDERWISAAISDDHLVAGLLLRLKSSTPLIIPPPSWPVKQPRSSPSYNADVIDNRDPRHLPRGSPTSTLSVGPTSPSDDSNVTGLHRVNSNNKVSSSIEKPATTTKRHRRKKTFAELKEEESLLMKEQTYLEKKLATLRVEVQERRSTNEKLKRIKIELKLEPTVRKPEFVVPDLNVIPEEECGQQGVIGVC